ncbi:MAG TPA: hypothetical protein VI382_01655, partial [Candidatus Manganitrophaceae bacterium]|nr:hypothetical protein [Candidatus Manganitrophaceae bacterium]
SLILEKNTTEGPLQRFISDHQIALSDLLPAYPSDREMEAIFIKGFERALGIELAPGDLTEEEMKTADHLAREKYGNDAWNWRRETEAGK